MSEVPLQVGELIAMDMTGLSDPFCVVKMGEDQDTTEVHQVPLPPYPRPSACLFTGS